MDLSELVNFSQRDTTVDQARIENEINQLSLAGKNILHVGVGNSKLAQRFSPKVDWIDGLTVSIEEKNHGQTLRLSNYQVFLMNKYSDAILDLKNRYDIISDNNLAGFACCEFHYERMLTHYLTLLRPQGLILTDKRGMEWSRPGGGKLGYEDLKALENRFPVTVGQRTDYVYFIQKA